MFKHPNPLAIKRLDHLGIVAGIIDEIGLVEKIDELIPPAPQRIVSCGNAVKAMILNALGFVSRPLYMHPQFFSGKPVEHLFRDDKTTLVTGDSESSSSVRNWTTPPWRPESYTPSSSTNPAWAGLSTISMRPEPPRSTIMSPPGPWSGWPR